MKKERKLKERRPIITLLQFVSAFTIFHTIFYIRTPSKLFGATYFIIIGVYLFCWFCINYVVNED
ncbi:hypothetical protein [Anaerosporobacter faecicola]|uniref:hypothetical protein n=1 Tax=Anaerosporobacter faecicola TaxID=2718714 RepID=UPI00143978AB|nr:hypothetical protein [Anaerosporobacter faecicola]